MTAKTKSLRARFLEFDDRLARLGVPPLTAWWRAGIGKWLDAYERGHVLELWAAVGRGASKSTTLYKLALFFTLYGDFTVPPGERHYAVVLSLLKEEAAKAPAIIAAWLRLLRIPAHEVGDVVELDEMARGIRVVAASVSATSGWRSYFVGKDERSKWPMGGAADLDAEEIDTSAAAMTATHPLAPVISVGSAWGMFGAFYDAITSGSDDARIVLGPTPTWVAAPHITEEWTRKKERNPRRWAREYKCEFQAGALGCFDIKDIDRAFLPRAPGIVHGSPILVVDPSSGAKDLWTFGSVRWEHYEQPDTARDPRDNPLVWGLEGEELQRRLAQEPQVAAPSNESGQPFLRFGPLVGIDAEEARRLTFDGVAAKMASFAKTHGARAAHGDQRESFGLTSALRREHLPYHSHAWTSANKPPSVELVRRWLREGTIALPPGHEQLRREMVSFEERIDAKSGQFTFGGRGQGDDFVSLLVTAALVHLEGGLRAPRERTTGGRPGSATAPAPALAPGQHVRADGAVTVVTKAGSVTTGGSEIAGGDF